jgi:hypothetical protein
VPAATSTRSRWLHLVPTAAWRPSSQTWE